MLRKNEIYRIDYVLVSAVMAVIIIGILMIYSAGFDPIDRTNNGLYKRQIVWFIVGFILMLIMTFVRYKSLGDYCLYIYFFVLALVIVTTFFGTPIRNTRAWLTFGYFSIQPSEFMKLAVVIVLAKYLELRERDIHHLRELLVPTAATAVPVLFILMQPDFGTAMVFIPVLFAMLFIGGADASHLIAVISIAAIALIFPMVLTYREWVAAQDESIIVSFFKDYSLLFSVAGFLMVVAIAMYVLHFFMIKKIFRKIYIPSVVVSLGLFFSVFIMRFLKDYQKKRILVFLNPDLDPHGSGYNVIQSKIAIGSGGFFGKGFLNGSQAQLGFLPEKSSDFIFPVIAEEWGFLGAVVILGLLCLIVMRGAQIALEAKDKFGALLAAGISSIFFFHILINVGMVLGIMPVTGLPLSFVSYGGSNLLVGMISIGILINIRMNKFVY
ncbi:MAG TPA: rod shape-determining protein RodA [Spirochaetota bacterium]|jgi:rod shape determining protein RodA|nr:rod shape-determining protein RodA [Spirochaetota bacterium]HOW83740.1 rod shape-determining protein RodA [Spirochaetota bacterium]